MHLHRTKIRKAAIWLCEASSTFLFIRKHSANIKTQGLPVLSKCVYLFNINARYIIRLLKSPAVHIKKAQLHFFSARLFSASHLRAELCPDPRHTALLLQRGSAPLRVDRSSLWGWASRFLPLVEAGLHGKWLCGLSWKRLGSCKLNYLLRSNSTYSVVLCSLQDLLQTPALCSCGKEASLAVRKALCYLKNTEYMTTFPGAF